MDNLLERYAGDVDLLLTEACMTAGLHGLDASVTGIAAHLRDLPGKEGAAALAQSLAKIAIRDYQAAIAFADEVLGRPNMAELHHQANEFRNLAAQLAAGQRAQPLDVRS